MPAEEKLNQHYIGRPDQNLQSNL